MQEYHCFFVDSADQVVTTLTIHCRNDSEARTRANKLLETGNHIGVEVWIDGRKLYHLWKPGFDPSTLK